MKKRLVLLALLLCALIALCAGASAEGYPESAHPYGNSIDQTWTYTGPASADYLKITFSSETATESGCDYLYITDSAGTQQRFSGNTFCAEPIFVKGHSFTIRLTSDSSVTKYGFAITAIESLTQAEYDAQPPTFTISRGTITGGTNLRGDIVIPAEVNGQTVYGIGSYAFLNRAAITSVTLPEGLTSIGYHAFSECTSLRRVTLPQSLKTIGTSAFFHCTALESITIPSSITSVGGAAFYQCTGLTNIVFLGGTVNLSEYELFGCTALRTIVGTVHSIETNALRKCASLEQLTLSDSITSFDCANMPKSTVYHLNSTSPILDTIRSYGFNYVTDDTGETNMVVSNATTAEQKADDIVATLIKPGMSDYQKALVLHNWLTFNADYDQTYSQYSAAGVLLHGTGVCQSYALAYQMLLNRVGIENALEYGKDHVWNMVRLDGEWYHVDCTWDDPIGGGGENWDYFGVTNYALEGVRSHECELKEHIATNYRYNYDYMNGLLDRRLNELTETIQAAISAGEGTAVFKPGSFFDEDYGLENRTAILIARDRTYTYGNDAAAIEITLDSGTYEVTMRVLPLSGSGFTLPANLTRIEDEAFMGIDAAIVTVPGKVRSIGGRAFAQSWNLRQIAIPASVTSIADDAFEGCVSLRIVGKSGSAAETYAREKGYLFIEE